MVHIGQSLSLSDNGGRQRGNETDIPYLPWAREKTLSERSSRVPTRDLPAPPTRRSSTASAGVPPQLSVADQDEALQTPEAVYILHEDGPFSVCLVEQQTSRGPGSAVVGHSIGWYENDKHWSSTHRLQRQDLARSGWPSAHPSRCNLIDAIVESTRKRWSST